MSVLTTDMKPVPLTSTANTELHTPILVLIKDTGENKHVYINLSVFMYLSV